MLSTLSLLKENLKRTLAENLSDSLNQLKGVLSSNSSIYDDVIHQISKLNQTQKEFQSNIISKENNDLSVDRVRSSTISLINKIRSNDLNLPEENSTEFTEFIKNNNSSYIERVNSYNLIRLWLAENTKVFEIDHAQEVVDDGQSITSINFRIFNASIHIYGSYMKISSFSETTHHWIEKNDKSETFFIDLDYNEYIFNLIDINSIELVERKINKNKTLDKNERIIYEVTVKTVGDLKRIKNEHHGIKARHIFNLNTKSQREKIDKTHEGHIDKWPTTQASFQCTFENGNKFLKKITELKKIIEEI